MRIPISWLKEYIDLPQELKVFTDKMSMIGHMLDKMEVTDTDTVIDLELRGNRADCYAILGLAREWYACNGGRFDIPNITVDTQTALKSKQYQSIKVEVLSSDVHRFYSTVIRGVKVKPSPVWLQTRLKDYGINPINNIVDITNYVMVETGMPMHAFDLAKIDGGRLIIRNSTKGEKFFTFEGTEKELTGKETVFASENAVLGLVGIIGSKDSGISNDTQDILLECAAYDRVAIRKTKIRLNLHTEAALRHSHDLSASLCDYALTRATDMIIQLACDGDYSCIEGYNDYYPNPEKPKQILYNPAEVKRLGGIDVDLDRQIDILQRLEFKVEKDQNSNNLLITVPLFRTDIFESADIVEEVLRIYGYENIPSRILEDTIPEPIILKDLEIEDKVRDLLVSMGLNEVITVPMVTLEELEKTFDPLANRAIPLINPPTSYHTHMRTNMYTTLLQVAKRVIDRGDKNVSIFEVGKIYFKQDPNNPIPNFPHKPEFPYVEKRKISLLFASKKNEWDFYRVKGIIAETLDQLGINNVEYSRYEDPQYALAAEISQKGLKLGYIGIINNAINRNFDISPTVYVSILDVEALVKAEKTIKSYLPYSQYPSIELDMSVLVPFEVEAATLQKAIINSGNHLVRAVEIIDFIEKSGKKSILFRLHYQSKERTLSLDEVNALHISIENMLKSKFGVIIQGRDDIEDKLIPIADKKELINRSSKALSNIHHELTEPVNQFIVIGRILEVTKHANADKLVICKVDVGKAKPENTLYPNYLQIITGAENIKPIESHGKLVPVALPGAIVKSHHTGELIKIKVSKIRGEVSEGMLCSADEIGLPHIGYDGILILDDTLIDKVGQVLHPEWIEDNQNSINS